MSQQEALSGNPSKFGGFFSLATFWPHTLHSGIKKATEAFLLRLQVAVY